MCTPVSSNRLLSNAGKIILGFFLVATAGWCQAEARLKVYVVEVFNSDLKRKITMIIILGIGIPLIFVFLPICKNLGKLAKFAILLVGIPATAFALSLLQVITQSPEERAASNAAFAANKMAQIEIDCGVTKEQTEAWFATHKTGWAEHVEAGLKCVRDHK
ncbi:hypothetical protein ACO0LM_25105 [Undibacterium sp. Di26W]|uniref:hypothetical protein n=1 Tax=Undibacterium sp. Di26W TaxID=3413035 RepID=UPI003BF2A50F